MINESDLARKGEVLGRLSTNRSKKQLSADGIVRGKDAKRSILKRKAKDAGKARKKALKTLGVLGDEQPQQQ